MPLLKGNSKEIIASNIRELRHAGFHERQAIAIAMKHSRKGTKKVKK